MVNTDSFLAMIRTPTKPTHDYELHTKTTKNMRPAHAKHNFSNKTMFSCTQNANSRNQPIYANLVEAKKTTSRLRETMICSARRPRSESHNLIGFLIQRCRTAANLTLINVTLWSLGVRRTSLKKKKNVCRQALAAEPDPSPVGFLLAACVTPGPHLAVVAAT